tara:strand:- start:111 stop:296 length:186 start_codon:yes stop_codon:yes gene_type:complete
MPSSTYRRSQKSKYRITLEIEALDDFNPHQIDFARAFKLEGSEKVVSKYVEDLSTPDRYSA